ncbi:MAG: hypothetical protein M1829_001480, partial [Trizodia sp. TS-e1964]
VVCTTANAPSAALLLVEKPLTKGSPVLGSFLDGLKAVGKVNRLAHKPAAPSALPVSAELETSFVPVMQPNTFNAINADNDDDLAAKIRMAYPTGFSAETPAKKSGRLSKYPPPVITIPDPPLPASPAISEVDFNQYLEPAEDPPEESTASGAASPAAKANIGKVNADESEVDKVEAGYKSPVPALYPDRQPGFKERMSDIPLSMATRDSLYHAVKVSQEERKRRAIALHNCIVMYGNQTTKEGRCNECSNHDTICIFAEGQTSQKCAACIDRGVLCKYNGVVMPDVPKALVGALTKRKKEEESPEKPVATANEEEEPPAKERPKKIKLVHTGRGLLPLNMIFKSSTDATVNGPVKAPKKTKVSQTCSRCMDLLPPPSPSVVSILVSRSAAKKPTPKKPAAKAPIRTAATKKTAKTPTKMPTKAMRPTVPFSRGAPSPTCPAALPSFSSANAIKDAARQTMAERLAGQDSESEDSYEDCAPREEVENLQEQVAQLKRELQSERNLCQASNRALADLSTRMSKQEGMMDALTENVMELGKQGKSRRK